MCNHFVENYENMSDLALLELCKSGDNQAVAILIARYLPMVSARASALQASLSIEHDDLVQEGLIAVYSAIRSFDFHSSSFSTFARLCVDRALIGVARRQTAKKQIPESMVVGLEDVAPGDPEDPEHLLLQKETVSSLYERMNLVLSGFEKQVLKAYLAGMSHIEIATALSTSLKSVNNALTRIRRKLK